MVSKILRLNRLGRLKRRRFQRLEVPYQRQVGFDEAFVTAEIAACQNMANDLFCLDIFTQR